MLLDGTWSQAKALWWRNAWMLKCQRVILGPAQPSRYGKLRKEPRGDGLSTIEAAAMLLSEPREAARYRRDAACEFRADAGEVPGSAGHDAGDRAQAEEEGLPPAQAGLSRASSSENGVIGPPWLPMRGRPYMSSPQGATWRSGYATVCKTVYTSSILVVASINIINALR